MGNKSSPSEKTIEKSTEIAGSYLDIFLGRSKLVSVYRAPKTSPQKKAIILKFLNNNFIDALTFSNLPTKLRTLFVCRRARELALESLSASSIKLSTVSKSLALMMKLPFLTKLHIDTTCEYFAEVNTLISKLTVKKTNKLREVSVRFTCQGCFNNRCSIVAKSLAKLIENALNLEILFVLSQVPLDLTNNYLDKLKEMRVVAQSTTPSLVSCFPNMFSLIYLDIEIFDPPLFNAFSKNCVFLSKLRSLRIKTQNLNEESRQLFGYALTCLAELEQLDMSFDEEEIYKFVFSQIASAKMILRYLGCSYVATCSNFSRYLALCIGNLQKIEHLRINGPMLTFGDELIKFSAPLVFLTTVEFDTLKILEEGKMNEFANFLGVLKNLNNLTVVNMRRNCRLSVLFETLSVHKSNLLVLNLRKNDINDSDCTLVAKMLTSHVNLNRLDLSCNKIHLIGIVSLISGLTFLTELRYLNMSRNNFGDVAFQKLAMCVLKMKLLEELLVAQCGIEDGRPLIDLIGLLENLKDVDAQGNGIRFKDGKEIVKVVNEKCNMRRLILKENNIGSLEMIVLENLMYSKDVFVLE